MVRRFQPLTTASREFLEHPDPEFSDRPFLKHRGAVNIGREADMARAEKFLATFASSGVAMELWQPERLRSAVPEIKSDWTTAVYEPDCCDIDVGGLHVAYLRDAQSKGAELQCRSRVSKISRVDDGWEIDTGGEQYHVEIVVNTAGAWVDEVASLAGLKLIGIKPKRRTMVQIKTDPPSKADGALIVALDGSFYFKPEAGGSYWLSPHDEIESAPVDCAPEELDIAIAIDRFESVLDVKDLKIEHKWAGLEKFRSRPAASLWI